ncbi:MAG: ATP-binding protein [Gemmatimonadaceae bacterium]
MSHNPLFAGMGGGLELLLASPSPTIIFDSQHLRVLFANPAAEDRYGHSPDSMRVARLTDLMDPDDVPQLIAKADRPDGDSTLVERQRHRRKDGSLFPVHAAYRRFELHGRRLVILVSTELSELRALDDEERFVEKMEAMRRLGGGIAHEFNNLLTAMMATADLALESSDLPEPVRVDLRHIREAGRRAARMTRQLMAFSGSQTLVLRHADANHLIEQLRPLLHHVLPANITLRLDLKASGEVELDPARFEQAVLNLVFNAVDAMPDGGVLTVSTADSHDFVVVVVADTGTGIDEITLSRLFEPFHSTKGPTGGRGMGLASVWGTVRQMHGSIDIESGLGAGTRVRIFFQRVIPSVELEFAAPAEVVRDGAGGEVVLVVEDEPSVRAPLCRTLRNLGYFVLEADDGESALKAMQDHHAPVHLVISDVRMPRMDGTELVGHLRAWYPGLRVLFISGYSPEYLAAQDGRTMDGSHFLAKPFGLDVLARRVREILDAEWAG